MLEATEGFGVGDPVTVVLEGGPDAALILQDHSSPTLGAKLGKGRQKFLFPLFKHLPDRHHQFLYPRYWQRASELELPHRPA
jgi:hypothetical protein